MNGAPAPAGAARPSLLLVTTVPITLTAFLLPLADRMRERGWRVEAMAADAPADAVLAAHVDAAHDAPWSRRPLAPGSLSAPAAVAEVVAAGAFDVVHVHTPVAAFLTRYALRRRGVRPAVIYTAHGFHFHRGGPLLTNAVFRALEGAAAAWTDLIVTVNDDDAASARAFRGIDPSRVRLVRGIGVDTDAFRPDLLDEAGRCGMRESLGVRPHEFAVLMAAEFAPVKRHALALEALAATDDPGVVLVLAGSGPLEADVRALAGRLGVRDRVRFAGQRTDMPAVVAACDAALLTSAREGLNRFVLEAMAGGLPVVGTDVRGVTDAIGAGAGVVVDPSPAAIAAALTALASEPGLRATLGAAARDRAVAEFALPAVLDAYEELYREALTLR